MFTPWVCDGGHRLEIDGVTGKGRCRICNELCHVSTTPEAVREAIALDNLVPVKTIVVDGRMHKVETKECLYCNIFFETTYVNAKYCSDDCKHQQSIDRESNKKLGLIYCLFCSNEIISVDKRRKFCNDLCRENMRKG